MEILSRRVAEELRTPTEQSSSFLGRSLKGRCFNCRKPGQMARDCWSEPSRGESRSSAGRNSPARSSKRRRESPRRENSSSRGRDHKRRRRGDEGRGDREDREKSER